MTSPLESMSNNFAEIEADFPSSLPPNSWYIVAASALVSASDPVRLGELYNHITKEIKEPDQRRHVSRRLREFLMRQWITIGAPRCAIALGSLIQAEEPGDADLSFTRTNNAALDDANRGRGDKLLRRLYGSEKVDTMYKPMGADMEWLSKEVCYGLFWGETSILNSVETELLNYVGITCQGLSGGSSGRLESFLRRPLINHLNGLRSLGVSFCDAETVTMCAKKVARWGGKDTSSWPTVKELAPDWT